MNWLTKIILWKFSLIYRAAIFFWDIYWKIMPAVELPCKVISVGNIVAGGAGKTPLVIYLADLASKTGLQTAVVARGYKRKSKQTLKLDDNSIWQDVGDEPLEVYNRTDGVNVYVGRSKTEAAILATQEGAEVIIIDDGFQHRRLHRDIDIVCLDWQKPLGPGGMLPMGLLREPPAALVRADILIYTSYDPDSSQTAVISDNSQGIARFWSGSKIEEFVELRSKSRVTLQKLMEKKILAFCGLADPSKFAESLKKAGLTDFELMTFPDHYAYDLDDIKAIFNRAESYGARILLTSAKDAVKIESFDFGRFELYFTRQNISIIDLAGADQSGELQRRLGL